MKFPYVEEQDQESKENRCTTQKNNPALLSTTHSTFKCTNSTSFNPIMNYKKSLSDQELSKIVLKFFGFFIEDVFESQLEEQRIRNLEISFFISDNSISIIEPRQRNSGILQGSFLKRQNVLNVEGVNFIVAEDFRVGSDIIIVGQKISIYACDPFTRRLYDKLEIKQAPDSECPADNFKLKVSTGFIPKSFYGLNSYANNGCTPSQKQFLENDRKVLKYYAIFENEMYIIHYYLCDDCIEVIEVKVANSGKDPFPKLIKRQKIAKEYKIEIHQVLKMGEFFTYNDFQEKQTIQLLNKNFTILGCDEFTSKFYKDVLGTEFSVFRCEQTDDHSKNNVIIPPHNGFGSEEDSIQNVLKLIPKAPKKDYFSIVDNVGYLVMIGRLLTDEKENAKRRFVITFFFNDNTLMIYEPEVKNNGFKPGKFLEKNAYKNMRGLIKRRRATFPAN